LIVKKQLSACEDASECVSTLTQTGENQALFGAAGGIEVLVNLCKHHMNNANVLSPALGVIWNACAIKGMLLSKKVTKVTFVCKCVAMN